MDQHLPVKAVSKEILSWEKECKLGQGELDERLQWDGNDDLANVWTDELFQQPSTYRKILNNQPPSVTCSWRERRLDLNINKVSIIRKRFCNIRSLIRDEINVL